MKMAEPPLSGMLLLEASVSSDCRFPDRRGNW
jgi:hypothetical protein